MSIEAVLKRRQLKLGVSDQAELIEDIHDFMKIKRKAKIRRNAELITQNFISSLMNSTGQSRIQPLNTLFSKESGTSSKAKFP